MLLCQHVDALPLPQLHGQLCVTWFIYVQPRQCQQQQHQLNGA